MDVDGGGVHVWAGLSPNQIGSRLSINLHQNQLYTFAAFDSYAFSDFLIGLGVTYLEWTTALYRNDE